MKKLLSKYFIAGTSSVLAISATYLIIPQEGEVVNKNGEHVVYKDMVGIATTCWGQTGRDMEGVKISPGKVYSEDYCSRWFSKELVEYNKNMRKHVTVNLLPYEEVAYTSFVWNLGETNFKNSTLLKKLNAGDREGACQELLKWNRAGGKEVRGLTNRRLHEQKVCLGKDEEVNEALKALEASKTSPELFKQGSLGMGSQEPVKAVVELSKPSIPSTQDTSEQVCSIRFVGLCFNKPK